MKSYEFGLVFGGGIEVNQFLIDVRYDLGLTDLSKDSDYDGYDFSVKSRTWFFYGRIQVLVGLDIPTLEVSKPKKDKQHQGQKLLSFFYSLKISLHVYLF